MRKQQRAASPEWLENYQINMLIDFAQRHGGICKIHSHKKTIERWER